MFIKRIIDRFRGDPLKEPTSRPPAPRPITEPLEQQEEPEDTATNDDPVESSPGEQAAVEESQDQRQETLPSDGAETQQTSATELCGISPKMSEDEIRERLAVLYRRHNAAASSLEADMRVEAEVMLEAIVEVRHQYFGE